MTVTTSSPSKKTSRLLLIVKTMSTLILCNTLRPSFHLIVPRNFLLEQVKGEGSKAKWEGEESCDIIFRVLTSSSGLPFNGIFPIVSYWKFPILCRQNVLKNPQISQLYSTWSTYHFINFQYGDGWELNLCANCVIQNNLSKT